MLMLRPKGLMYDLLLKESIRLNASKKLTVDA